MLYLQLVAFPFLTLAALTVARRLPPRLWWLAVTGPLLIFALVILGRRSPWLSFFPPVRWAVNADVNPFLMTPAIMLLFATLVPRLAQRRTRNAVNVLVAFMLAHYGLLPAILPLAVRPVLAATVTRFDPHHVCLQAHSFTCGPAAAVTCLDRLGYPAQEAALAIAAECAPAVGTDPHRLESTICSLYPAVHCSYCYLDSLDALTVPAIADLTTTTLNGHYVAILEITPTEVIIGDPVSGLRHVAREQFLVWWKHTAILLTLRTPCPCPQKQQSPG